MDYLAKAIVLAVKKFEGKVDKGNKPYIGHLFRVMEKMTDDDLKTVAVLHDILEDTRTTADELKVIGIPDYLIHTIEVLTKKPGDKYDEYINRLINHKLAVDVKLADLEDNMDITRLEKLTIKDQERLRKYHKAWIKLKNHLISEKQIFFTINPDSYKSNGGLYRSENLSEYKIK